MENLNAVIEFLEGLLRETKNPNTTKAILELSITTALERLKVHAGFGNTGGNALVMPKIADNKFRELAEKTYLELAEDLIQMAGVDKKKARETRLIMIKAGFDNEDLQIIPIIERALWKAYNSNFSV